MLKGTVIYRNDPYILLDVHDVGYKVLVGKQILGSLQGIGQTLQVFTYTHVREDMLELYGFHEPQDLKLFELLISVSGIGPKTALGVFTLGTRQEIVQAIGKGDVTFFSGVARLGKKNAQKIIIELKSKFGGGETDLDLEGGREDDEVIAALVGFGFSQQEARDAMRKVVGENLSTSDRIRLALKQLGK